MVDEKRRISISQIKAHSWYNKALPARYQHAELDLLEHQKRVEAHIATRVLDEVRNLAFKVLCCLSASLC